MSEFPLLVDEPRCGIANMARDQALLEIVASGVLPGVLRFYQWQPATLSLGYFQAYAARQDHLPSLACPIVRRASGGGAILHDQELTYSLVLAADHPLARDTPKLYRAVHQALCDVLANLYHVTAIIWGDFPLLPPVQPSKTAHPQPSDTAPPFLCFLRRSPGDVVLVRPESPPLTTDLRLPAKPFYAPAAGPTLKTDKILGSAQRRRDGAVLQHGSLLLGQSKFAPELPGLAELTGQRIAITELINAWSTKLLAILGMDRFSPAQLSMEYTAAYGVAWEKFAAQEWLQTR
ncbi:MAG: hypothetical protein SFX18_09155 [Pirellulales bacterium]|nr:hypothetical protein [Pirellulales bacterium]